MISTPLLLLSKYVGYAGFIFPVSDIKGQKLIMLCHSFCWNLDTRYVYVGKYVHVYRMSQ